MLDLLLLYYYILCCITRNQISCDMSITMCNTIQLLCVIQYFRKSFHKTTVYYYKPYLIWSTVSNV